MMIHDDFEHVTTVFQSQDPRIRDAQGSWDFGVENVKILYPGIRYPQIAILRCHSLLLLFVAR